MREKFWFRKRRGLLSKDRGYGWIPISWEGNLLITLFVILNVISFYYFVFFKMEYVQPIIIFTFSIIIFAIIAKLKTKD